MSRTRSPKEINELHRKRSVMVDCPIGVNLGYYTIERIEILPEFRLKVYFVNGQVRVADILEMRGDNPMCREAFENFNAAANGTYDVAWPAVFNGEPNTVASKTRIYGELGNYDSCS